MPQAVAVSLVQCNVAGDSRAASLLEFVPERCWIYTSLGVLLRLVSIELAIVYPWLLTCSAC